MVVGKNLHIYNVDHGSEIKWLCDLVPTCLSRHVIKKKKKKTVSKYNTYLQHIGGFR